MDDCDASAPNEVPSVLCAMPQQAASQQMCTLPKLCTALHLNFV